MKSFLLQGLVRLILPMAVLLALALLLKGHDAPGGGFVAGLLLIYVFAMKLGWLPATGWNRLSNGLLDNLRTVILPALSLALIEIAVYTRVVRSDVMNTS